MNTPRYRRPSAYLLLLALLMMTIGGSLFLWRAAHTKRTVPPQRETFSATDLAEAYRADAALFRARHEGNRVRVVGIIDEHKLNEQFAPEVVLRGAFRADIRPRFVFHPAYEELFMSDQTGRELAISCMWHARKFIEQPIVLDDCELDP